MKLKELFYKILPSGFKNSVTKRQLLKQNYMYTSFAQVGEDRILERYFIEKKDAGFFVDIGANHPYIYSNTYKFYLQGWRGINVDATPGTKKLFEGMRPEDITLEMGISLHPSELDFYMFDNSVFNTFDKATADEHCRYFSIGVKDVQKIKTTSLSNLLDEYIKPGQKIDFMTIDVEGLDLEVLQSNNWEKYKPEVLVVECIYANNEDIMKMDLVVYLKELGYTFFAKTFSTFFFSLAK